VGAVVLAVGAVGVGLILWLNRSQPAIGSRPVEAGISNTQTAPASRQPEPGFQKLVGRWFRPDGGYVLEIRAVDDGGRLDAAYFNPNPIHVARAEASREGAVAKVFIELRDVNYPGSTYTLAYDLGTDRLAGNYFQALLRENFDVVFVRQP
jgi:hypothetical protein